MKTPFKICIKCCGLDGEILIDKAKFEWDLACKKKDHWRCPETVKPDTMLVSYPPPQCRYRAELFMLKDAGHIMPKEAC